VGATAIGDAVYVAGGGAVTGGSVQSSVHEAFKLAVRPRLPPAFVNSAVQRRVVMRSDTALNPARGNLQLIR